MSDAEFESERLAAQLTPDYVASLSAGNRVWLDRLLEETGPCRGNCGHIGKTRCQPTAYADVLSNWTQECDACFEKTCEYWDEMWAEYHRSQG